MTGAYAYTPAIWPPLVAAAFLVAIGLYAWRRRDVPGGKPFVAMSVLSILTLVGIAFEAAAVIPATKLAWYRFQFVLLLVAVTPVTCFVLDYAYPGRWLTRRNVVLLSTPALLCLLMVVIDDSQLIWRQLDVAADGSVTLSYAPAGAIVVAYGIGMFLLYGVVFLWLFIRSPQHRWPVALMLLGMVGSRAAFLLDIADPPSLAPFDFSVFVVLLPWTTYAIAMFGFHILDPLPAARRTVIEQMQAGVVVFDARWQVVSLNPAAERIPGVGTGVAYKKPWRQLLPPGAPRPDLPNASPQEAGAAIDLREISFGNGSAARQYAPSVSPLRDFRGLLMSSMTASPKAWPFSTYRPRPLNSICRPTRANVRKHAGAPEQVSVQMRVDNGQVHLAVTDDGTGFDPDARGLAGRHYGLQVMCRRAERIGGQFAVHTAPGHGTRVEVCVPLGKQKGGSAA